MMRFPIYSYTGTICVYFDTRIFSEHNVKFGNYVFRDDIVCWWKMINSDNFEALIHVEDFLIDCEQFIERS